MSSKIEQAFENRTKYVFIFILPTPNLPSFFGTFSLYFFIFHILILLLIYVMVTVFNINDCHKSG